MHFSLYFYLRKTKLFYAKYLFRIPLIVYKTAICKRLRIMEFSSFKLFYVKTPTHETKMKGIHITFDAIFVLETK